MSAVGFMHAGQWVTNPTQHPDTGDGVSPAFYGFEIIDTGGGCTAWHKDLGDGHCALLTSFDGGSHHFERGESLIFGLYDTDDYCSEALDYRDDLIAFSTT